MKLLTKAIEKALPALYSTDGQAEKKVIVKYFTPDSSFTWLVFEGERTEDGDLYFFGAVDGGDGFELGYFTLSQLAEIRGQFGLPVERDLHHKGTYKMHG